MRNLVLAIASTACFLAAGAVSAADLPLKAPPAPPAPVVATWTGFYVGAAIGGGWGSRDVTYTGNDPAAAALLAGTIGTPGEQPLSPNSFSMSGVTGGIAAGYNWQLDRRWLVGVEVDFSGADIKGQGSTTSLLATGPVVPQTISEQQSIDWYGTVRGRLGWLARDDLLLFATGGFAYGHVADSANYATGGPPGLPFFAFTPAGSFLCTTGTTCFAGSSSATRTGWTAGAGAEWRLDRRWSLKAEYQYVDLGSDAVTVTAFVPFRAALPLATFNVSQRDDFHVARVGVNYHF